MHLVELLLEVDGINPNFVGGLLQTAPLILAVRQGLVGFLKLKLPAINFTSHTKAASHYVKAAKLLLEREDIDINRPDNNGCTALFWACSIDDDAYRVGSSVAIVRLLLSRRDTDPNAVNDNGDSVFAHFIRRRGFIDSHEASEIEFLLQKAGSM